MASGLFEKKTRSGVWWRDHSLSIVIFGILVVQTGYAIYAGSYVFARELPLGDTVGPWSTGFWTWWGWEYMVSLVADTYGVLLIVLLSKWFREVGSAEDTESN
jgi:hypothetical protein